MGLAAVPGASAHGGDGTKLHSCVANDGTGGIRMIAAAEVCDPLAEDPLDWTGNALNATGNAATVAGGSGTIASGSSSSVGGGSNNTATGAFATVAGGQSNRAAADYSTVAGGGRWDPNNPATANRATSLLSTVGGGANNQAGDNAGAVGSGAATVAGGANNTASGGSSFVGAGGSNQATANFATVAGGQNNLASGTYATVGGGGNNDPQFRNAATGDFSTVPGGESNLASGFLSFAAGNGARAIHAGAFVLNDSSPVFTASTAANQFTVRAVGGTRIISAIDGAGNPTAGVQLAPGSGGWSTLSDRDAKEHFASMDPRQVLERLLGLDVSTWNYKTQSASVRHIGPVAQDFKAAFQVGESDKHINTVDAQGVALAAIQGLAQVVQDKDVRIAGLEHQLAAQQQQITSLESRLAALERGLTMTRN